jgi:hypothetical protein
MYKFIIVTDDKSNVKTFFLKHRVLLRIQKKKERRREQFLR